MSRDRVAENLQPRVLATKLRGDTDGGMTVGLYNFWWTISVQTRGRRAEKQETTKEKTEKNKEKRKKVKPIA